MNEAKKGVRKMTRYMMMKGFSESPEKIWSVEEMNGYLEKTISKTCRTYHIQGQLKILVIEKKIVRVGTGLYQVVR